MAQEALANPGRQHTSAPAAARRRRRSACLADVARAFARRLVWRQWSIARRHRATLMRHEVAAARLQRGGLVTGLLATALAPTARASSVGHAAGAAVLVTARCLALRGHSRCARTGATAVALPTIAAAAQQHLRAATRTHEQAGGMLGQAVGSSGASSPRPPRPSRCHGRLLWTTASGNATLAPHSLLACVGYGVRFSLPG